MSSNRKETNVTQVSDFDDFKIHNFKEQNYEELKNDCLKKNILFEDPFFPAVESSLFYTKKLPFEVNWKRPFEIVGKGKNALFIDGKLSADDLDQGHLGNCWFISACASVTLVPELINKVVPQNQVCNGDGYCGIFHFRFWLYGQWFDVVIDDRLPVTYDNKLVFCRSIESPNEFWAALLEKAYAKIAMGYENLDGGFTTDAVIDMTGGIQESFNLVNMKTQAQKDSMWNILVKSRQHNSLLGASINPNPKIREARLINGLVMGHAYAITKIALIELYGKDIRLIRLRNPWGNDVEWNGMWSDKSNSWKNVSEDIKKQILFNNKPEGEFWMDYDDFFKNFDVIELCSLTPDAYSDEFKKNHPNMNLKWNMVAYNGKWISGESAGGSGKTDKNMYWKNPQFLITLTDVDPTDNENMATIIISLMQKYTREKRIQNNGEPAENFIQFRLYKIKNKDDALIAKSTNTRLYASQLELTSSSGAYTNLRDITKRFRVPPGDYVIIPSCFDIDVEGDFLMRIFTEQNIDENNYKSLNTHKRGKLNVDDVNCYFNIENNKNNQEVSNNNHPWKSSYTSRLIGSRSIFFPIITQSIYERSSQTQTQTQYQKRYD